MDMLDVDSVQRALADIGAIDHLVLTAVADENQRRGRVQALSDEQFERSVDKFRGFFNVVRAAAPKMAERGSITLTSGDSAFKPPREGMSVLAGVNAAVASFGHALALAGAGEGERGVAGCRRYLGVERGAASAHQGLG